MDREAWRAAIHGVAKSQIRLSEWTELNWMKAARGSLNWYLSWDLINQGNERNSFQRVGLSRAKALGQECVRVIKASRKPFCTECVRGSGWVRRATRAGAHPAEQSLCPAPLPTTLSSPPVLRNRKSAPPSSLRPPSCSQDSQMHRLWDPFPVSFGHFCLCFTHHCFFLSCLSLDCSSQASLVAACGLSWGLWDPSSPAGGQTRAPYTEGAEL